MATRDQLHDEIDLSEDFREQVQAMVEDVKGQLLKIAPQFDNFRDLFSEAALRAENRAADLTTEVVKKFFELGRKRSAGDVGEGHAE